MFAIRYRKTGAPAPVFVYPPFRTAPRHIQPEMCQEICLIFRKLQRSCCYLARQKAFDCRCLRGPVVRARSTLHDTCEGTLFNTIYSSFILTCGQGGMTKQAISCRLAPASFNWDHHVSPSDFGLPDVPCYHHFSPLGFHGKVTEPRRGKSFSGLSGYHPIALHHYNFDRKEKEERKAKIPRAC